MPDEILNEDSQKMIQEIKERKQLYQNVFESPDGKKVLEEISRYAFVHKTTYNDNPHRMAFNEGQRSILLHIQSMMKIDIDRTSELIKKQQKESDNV